MLPTGRSIWYGDISLLEGACLTPWFRVVLLPADNVASVLTVQYIFRDIAGHTLFLYSGHIYLSKKKKSCLFASPISLTLNQSSPLITYPLLKTGRLDHCGESRLTKPTRTSCLPVLWCILIHDSFKCVQRAESSIAL
jgi:hypothetical protein